MTGSLSKQVLPAKVLFGSHSLSYASPRNTPISEDAVANLQIAMHGVRITLPREKQAQTMIPSIPEFLSLKPPSRSQSCIFSLSLSLSVFVCVGILGRRSAWM
ncbi:hypothetical protein VNO77_00155 [Canavalia gladiata]|uniref:Uncharacterized protein n=1 Tax=Canavalia gladiata TaxID=3824 RepID=A0AAN9MNU2_CANGL